MTWWYRSYGSKNAIRSNRLKDTKTINLDQFVRGRKQKTMSRFAFLVFSSSVDVAADAADAPFDRSVVAIVIDGIGVIALLLVHVNFQSQYSNILPSTFPDCLTPLWVDVASISYAGGWKCAHAVISFFIFVSLKIEFAHKKN